MSHTLEYARYELRRTFRNRRLYILSFAFPLALYYAIAAPNRGEHSIGAVWRRDRLSCPTRDQLGAYLLQALDPDLIDYIAFHLQTVGCPYCQANLDDLKKVAAPKPAAEEKEKDKKSGGKGKKSDKK